MLRSVIQSLGLTYGFLLFFVGFAAIAKSVSIVSRPNDQAAYGVVRKLIFVPILIGLFAALHGLLSVLHEASVMGFEINQNVMFPFIISVLSPMFIGAGFSIVSYVILVAGEIRASSKGTRLIKRLRPVAPERSDRGSSPTGADDATEAND